jgi:hypothetical protein
MSSTLKVDAIIDSAGGNTTTINGYIPVQQGGGTNMGDLNVKIGWRTDGQGLAVQVGSTPLGVVVRNVDTPTGLNQQLSAPGSAPIFACRAWVNFNGTGAVGNQTIRANGNVSSVEKSAAGVYTVYFANPMPDANYAAVITSTDLVNNFVIGVSITAMTTTYVTFRCQSSNHAGYDGLYVNVAIFR